MLLRFSAAATLSLLTSMSASAAPPTPCEQALKKIGKDLADVHCFVSTDLTTNGAQTTPANNSILTLPAFAFTPTTDRNVIAPSAAKRPPITKAVPGVQIEARIRHERILPFPRRLVRGERGAGEEQREEQMWFHFAATVASS